MNFFFFVVVVADLFLMIHKIFFSKVASIPVYHNALYVRLKRPTLIITILYVLFYSNSKYILMMPFYMNGLAEYMLILAYFLFLAKK